MQFWEYLILYESGADGKPVSDDISPPTGDSHYQPLAEGLHVGEVLDYAEATGWLLVGVFKRDERAISYLLKRPQRKLRWM